MKKQNFIYLLLGLVIAALYAYRLDFPPNPYFDEVYHVKTAREFIALSGNTDTVHPPLVKLLVSWMIRLLGDKSWVWRLVSLISGLGSLAVFFVLARRFFKSQAAALLAMLLLALDGLFLTQARITMHNAPMLFFMLMSLWLMLRGLENPARRNLFLPLSGVFLGLAAASRWVGLGIIPVMVMVGLFYRRGGFQTRPYKLLLFYILIPLAVYIAAHLILLYLKSYGTWQSIWAYQVNMFKYHHHLKAGHPYGSAWWSWPIMSRPIRYFFSSNDQITQTIYAIANPAVLWAFFPAVGFLIWDIVKQPRARFFFLFLGFLSQWLPWIFISRLKFFHYFYTAMPFVALTVAYYLRELWKTGPQAKITVGLYLLLVLGMFVYWYPLWTGFPISAKYYAHHLWFRTWA